MYDFRLFITWLSIIVSVIVCGIILYSVVVFRQSKGTHVKHHFHQNTLTEIVWTTIPLLIFIGMAIPSIKMVINAENTEIDSEKNEDIQSVKVEQTIDYESNKEWTLRELMRKGKKIYEKQCAQCHQVSGLGILPSFPALKGSKIATQTDLIDQHILLVIQGKNAMPSFANLLNDLEISAVVTYERNAWDNNTSDVIQPLTVRKLR